MSLGPKEKQQQGPKSSECTIQQLAHNAGEKATLQRPQESLAFKENEPQEMGSSEPNKLKPRPQTGMTQPEAECGEGGVRDKITAFLSGPKQNLFSSKTERTSEYTGNTALLRNLYATQIQFIFGCLPLDAGGNVSTSKQAA